MLTLETTPPSSVIVLGDSVQPSPQNCTGHLPRTQRILKKIQKHVQDVLKLAVLAVCLPLYRGALDGIEYDASRSWNNLNNSVPPLDGIGDDNDAATLLKHKECANGPDGKAENTIPVVRPVYDFELVVQPSAVTNGRFTSSSGSNDGCDKHYLCNCATLDRLCQHAIVRLIV